MQNVIENVTEQTTNVRRSRTYRMRARLATIMATAAALVIGSVAPSFATSTDPLSGAGDTIFSTLTGYLTSHLVPLVFGLAVVSIAIGLVLRWVRKAVHA